MPDSRNQNTRKTEAKRRSRAVREDYGDGFGFQDEEKFPQYTEPEAQVHSKTADRNGQNDRKKSAIIIAVSIVVVLLIAAAAVFVINGCPSGEDTVETTETAETTEEYSTHADATAAPKQTQAAAPAETRAPETQAPVTKAPETQPPATKPPTEAATEAPTPAPTEPPTEAPAEAAATEAEQVEE